MVLKMSLIDDIVKFKSQIVLEEERNMRLLLHAYLSAYTDEPINVAVTAPSSEGKTWMVMHTVDVMPADDVIVLHRASAKAFTRERGETALFQPEAEERNRYTTVVRNEFTDTQQSVDAYFAYLYTILKSKEEEDKERQQQAREILDDLNNRKVTLVGLRHKLIVFLEEPPKELWVNLLAVLSHDAYWTVTKFVEGEGLKKTRTVVFEGWPAVVFCTSKVESTFGWLDLNTRFELLEPTQTGTKYMKAIENSLRKSFGDFHEDPKELNALREKVAELSYSLKNSDIQAVTPFDPSLLAKLVKDPQTGQIMRKFKYWASHLRLETFWHRDDRIRYTDGSNEYVFVYAEDLQTLLDTFSTLELLAEVNGISATVLEFYLNVVLPLGQGKPEGVARGDVIGAVEGYVAANKKTKVKKSKPTIYRYIKELETLNFIDSSDKSEGKRGGGRPPEKITTRVELSDLMSFSHVDRGTSTDGREFFSLLFGNNSITPEITKRMERATAVFMPKREFFSHIPKKADSDFQIDSVDIKPSTEEEYVILKIDESVVSKVIQEIALNNLPKNNENNYENNYETNYENNSIYNDKTTSLDDKPQLRNPENIGTPIILGSSEKNSQTPKTDVIPANSKEKSPPVNPTLNSNNILDIRQQQTITQVLAAVRQAEALGIPFYNPIGSEEPDPKLYPELDGLYTDQIAWALGELAKVGDIYSPKPGIYKTVHGVSE